jgi:hypothetical protein
MGIRVFVLVDRAVCQGVDSGFDADEKMGRSGFVQKVHDGSRRVPRRYWYDSHACEKQSDRSGEGGDRV